jgi:hypothetical protein
MAFWDSLASLWSSPSSTNTLGWLSALGTIGGIYSNIQANRNAAEQAEQQNRLYAQNYAQSMDAYRAYQAQQAANAELYNTSIAGYLDAWRSGQEMANQAQLDWAQGFRSLGSQPLAINVDRLYRPMSEAAQRILTRGVAASMAQRGLADSAYRDKMVAESFAGIETSRYDKALELAIRAAELERQSQIRAWAESRPQLAWQPPTPIMPYQSPYVAPPQQQYAPTPYTPVSNMGTLGEFYKYRGAADARNTPTAPPNTQTLTPVTYYTYPDAPPFIPDYTYPAY